MVWCILACTTTHVMLQLIIQKHDCKPGARGWMTKFKMEAKTDITSLQ